MTSRRLCVFASFLLLLGGCGLTPGPSQPALEPASESSAAPSSEESAAPAAVPAAETGYQYRLRKPSRFDPDSAWLVDENGNDLPAGDQFLILYDRETNEPQCQYLERIEDTGERNEWGGPITRTLRALYDMDGKLLRDWEEYRYSSGCGDLIIRMKELNYPSEGGPVPEPDEYDTALWNFRTNEPVLEGVYNLYPLSEGEYLITDSYGSPLGMVDQNGALIKGPPEKKYYNAEAADGRVIASTVNLYDTELYDKSTLEYALLDRNDTELALYEMISSGYYAIHTEDAFFFRDGDTFGLLGPGGEILFEIADGTNLEYYDGEQYILYSGAPRSEIPPLYQLIARDDTLLATGFTYLTADLTWEDEGPAERYIGIRDGRAVLIDRTGQELFSAELPENTTILYPMGGGFYSYLTEYSTETEYLQKEGLLGPELQEIVPFGKYSSFQWASVYAGDGTRQWAETLATEADLLVCISQSQNGQQYLWAVLRRDGSVVVDGISQIHDIGPDRIALTRGFSIGLMDWQGEWIVKRSIFSEWMDD